jgi:hypothetical protein
VTVKSYAVVFTYSWDNDAAVYLFDTEEEAVDFLAGAYDAEVKNDVECGFESEYFIDSDGYYARITRYSSFGDDITEFHLGRVYE